MYGWGINLHHLSEGHRSIARTREGELCLQCWVRPIWIKNNDDTIIIMNDINDDDNYNNNNNDNDWKKKYNKNINDKIITVSKVVVIILLLKHNLFLFNGAFEYVYCLQKRHPLPGLLLCPAPKQMRKQHTLNAKWQSLPFILFSGVARSLCGMHVREEDIDDWRAKKL